MERLTYEEFMRLQEGEGICGNCAGFSLNHCQYAEGYVAADTPGCRLWCHRNTWWQAADEEDY